VSTARSKDQRRADALSIGGQTARLRVGDEARSLLVGGDFLIPARWSGFASAVDDIDGRIRCHESGDFPAPDMVLTADQVAYCETCQRNVPVVGDPLRYADHDKRGRTIEGEEGRA
jgi:hypothetical protein